MMSCEAYYCLGRTTNLLVLVIRKELSENPRMKGRVFVERGTQLGRENDVPVRLDAKRGKGSHAILYYGDRKCVLKDRSKVLGPADCRR